MAVLQTIGLFVLTALAEIIGCYLPYLWLRKGHSIWLLAPAAVSLALFAWLLTLHPTASGEAFAKQVQAEFTNNARLIKDGNIKAE